jgi:hypothetical protein
MRETTDVQRDRDPEEQMQRGADELEERLDHLGEDIDDARRELRARQEDADIGEDVAGDWEDTDDDTGGDDPTAFDDPEDVDDLEGLDDEDDY